MLAILGAGAMGAALAVHLSRAGRSVVLLATQHDGAVLDAVNNGEPHPGLGAHVPDAVPVVPHREWRDVLAGAEGVVVAVSTAGIRATVEEAARHAWREALWIVATKGWEEPGLRRGSVVVSDVLGDASRVAVVVGPSIAGEIAAGVPTAVVAASENPAVAGKVASWFSSDTFRAYTSDDVAGVEVGGAVKNVVAIGVGMCDGLAGGFGVPSLTNTKAFLFSRGLVEIARLAIASGGRPATVLGLAGAGDLFVTCLSGRNGRFGRLIGAGTPPETALALMHTTVEGYANAHAAVELAKRRDVDLPIVNAVHRVLYEGQSPRSAIAELVAGNVEDEFDP